MGSPPPASSPRITPLDGLRGLAIAMVLVWHYFMQMEPALPDWKFFETIWPVFLQMASGVDLFFVLSGLLIGGILLDQRASPDYFRVFYFRRTCRIFPLYYAVVLAGFCFYAGVQKVPYLTFTQNLWGQIPQGNAPHMLGVTWSLALEEQFYLVMPLLILILPRRMLAGLMLGLLGAAPWLRTHATYYEAMFATYCRWDGLAWGVLLALALRSDDFKAAAQKHRALFAWVAGVVFLVAWVVPCLRIVAFGPLKLTIMAAGYAMATYYAMVGGWVARLFSWRPLVGLGRISYSLYLIHYPVLHLVFHNAPALRLASVGDVGRVLLALALSLMLASLSFRFIEQPLMRFGHRLKYQTSSAA